MRAKALGRLRWSPSPNQERVLYPARRGDHFDRVAERKLRDLVRIIAAESQDGGWKEAVGPVSWLTLGLVASFLLRAAFLFLMGYVAHIVAWSYVRDLTVSLYDLYDRQFGAAA